MPFHTRLSFIALMIAGGIINFRDILTSRDVVAFQQGTSVGHSRCQNHRLSNDSNCDRRFGSSSRQATSRRRQAIPSLGITALPKPISPSLEVKNNSRNNHNDVNDDNKTEGNCNIMSMHQKKGKQVLSRRQSLMTAGGYISSGWLSTFISEGASSSSPPSANAAMMGLVQFPCKNGLMNTYHLMRAGTSGLEEEDLWGTNPLFLTNSEDSLSQKGIVQVQEACRILSQHNINPSVIKYSLAAKCMDASNIIGNELRIGRNRIVPEYTFMDQRGIGKWDMMPMTQTKKAVWAMDHDEAGAAGLNGRPPPNDDGTANETLEDQVVRLRQLMSVLETQFSGDSILLIFPDGTSPALLSTLISGIPLNRVHELEFSPGEIRLDVQYQSGLKFLASAASSENESYKTTIEEGRKQLAYYRENHDNLMTRQQQKDREAFNAHINAEKEKDERAKEMDMVQMKHEAMRRKKLSMERMEQNEERKRKRRERLKQFSSVDTGIKVPSPPNPSNQQQIAKRETRSRDEVEIDGTSMSVQLTGAVALLSGIKFLFNDNNGDDEDECSEVISRQKFDVDQSMKIDASVITKGKKIVHRVDYAASDTHSHTGHDDIISVVKNSTNSNGCNNNNVPKVVEEKASIHIETNSIEHDVKVVTMPKNQGRTGGVITGEKKEVIVTSPGAQGNIHTNDVTDVTSNTLSQKGTATDDAIREDKKSMLDDFTVNAIFDDNDEIFKSKTTNADTDVHLDTTVSTISLNNKVTNRESTAGTSSSNGSNLMINKSLEEMEEKFKNEPFVIPEMKTNGGGGEMTSAWSWNDQELFEEQEEIKKMQEREKLAKRAMEEYMDRDDGANDFDILLRELMG